MLNKYEIFVRATFIEPLLGTEPGDPDIYRSYIGKKAPDAATMEEEIADLGVNAVAEKGITVFKRYGSGPYAGQPYISGYQVGGFFKSSCYACKKYADSATAKSKAARSYKKDIDNDIKVYGLNPEGKRVTKIRIGAEQDSIDVFQRPLRASTPKGEITSLAASERVPKRQQIEFVVEFGIADYNALVREWLDKGVDVGLGQRRSAGNGRFFWEELDALPDGNVIGGNRAEFEEKYAIEDDD
ncbi:MAG: hypothetical protein LIO54_03505 [Oscillospiraceae bacterium]|nr:hypothetical protein [Oscillospiraceae bacterium]